MVLEAVGPELLQPLPPEHKTGGAEGSQAEPVRCHGWDTGGPGQPQSVGPQQEVLAMEVRQIPLILDFAQIRW